jgi:AraC-like DNA-binding protein
LLTERLQQYEPKLTSWGLRKAEQQGLIHPDKIGRFAGHAVHYYDAARIPELIRQLLPPVSWTAGTLIIHPHLGPGRILCADPADPSRRVIFFFDSAPASVRISDIRRLLSARVMAQHVGVNRKSFARISALRGINPDYADTRKFYDEARVREIRELCFSARSISSVQAGWVVLDTQHEIARVEYVHADGHVTLRMLTDGRLTQTTNLCGLGRLVSTRELARLEGMSRYKVNRLLTVVGVRPVHQHGKTLYFQLDHARQAISTRIGREASATRLRDVARRCGVSPELLARKVRQECIRTTGSANHTLDEREVQRIERLNRARRSGWQRLCEAGICHVQPRGRWGHEVVSWDLSRLIQVAQTLSAHQREALFDEVAWACDGAGQRRFEEALEHELWQWRALPEHSRRKAELLLSLFAHMPKMHACQSHVALIASDALQRYCLSTKCLRLLARESGCRTEIALRRFMARVDQQVADLLIEDRQAVILTGASQPQAATNGAYLDDEFVPGAVTLAVTDKQPQVGMIVRVEQRSWNTLTRSWEKTVVVGFNSKEVRMNPYVSACETNSTVRGVSLRVLLRVSESIAVARVMRDLTAIAGDRSAGAFLLKRAS